MIKRKLNLSDSYKAHDFYQVLKVLYYFVDEESKGDTGKVLDYMNHTKSLIVELAECLGSVVLLYNWYDITKKDDMKDLKDLVDHDDETGFYSKKTNLG